MPETSNRPAVPAVTVPMPVVPSPQLTVAVKLVAAAVGVRSVKLPRDPENGRPSTAVIDDAVPLAGGASPRRTVPVTVVVEPWMPATLTDTGTEPLCAYVCAPLT